MKPRMYKFLLAEDSKDGMQPQINIKTVEALSFQEAMADAYIHLHGLKSSTNKTWRIIEVTDTTHYDGIKSL